MNRAYRAGALLFLVFPVIAEEPATQLAQAPDKPPAIAEESKPVISLVLSDTSTLKGHLRDEMLVGVSDVFGTLRIPMAEVASWTAEKEGFIRVVTRGSDTVRIKPEAKELSVETLLGVLAVPLANIRKATVSAPVSNEGLIYYCTFDSEDAIRHPAVGPEGKFFGGRFVPGKQESALLVDPWSHGAEVSYPAEFFGTKGCIEFWGRMPDAQRTTHLEGGGFPRFFTVFARGLTRGYLQYTGNNGAGNSGLDAMLWASWLASRSGMSSSFPVLTDSLTSWHHYALVWDSEGIQEYSEKTGEKSYLVVFLDGQPVPMVAGGVGRKNWFDTEDCLAEGHIGFPWPTKDDSRRGNYTAFMIDEFKIWNEPKTDFHLD